ncbi:MAG: helix-turn-helix domain-containing protein [Planctomycetes bacterium]|nr:helix-turn-helix domain-containing protein [Planctomycetota bacterium]
MYDHLIGPIVEKHASRAVVRCGGVGYECRISLHTAGELQVGAEHQLFTLLHVVDSVPSLLAFSTRAEREIARKVLSVSGVGPTIALALLSVYSPHDLAAAIAAGDSPALKRVKGVGQKKLDAFGEQFLAAIAAHCEGAGLALDAGAGSRPRPAAPAAPRPVVIGGSADSKPVSAASASSLARATAEALFEQGRTVAEVAVGIGRAESTTAQYLSEWIARRRPQSIEPWVAVEVQQRVAAVLDAAEGGRLKPVFEALGGAVDYETIRLVAAHRAALDAPGEEAAQE